MKKIICFVSCAIALMIGTTLLGQTLKAVDDTQNAGKVEWFNRSENTGKVPFGTPVTREFRMKNISRENLLLLQVRTTCHCVSLEWSREPIPPGETGVIRATYDAQREGDFYKVIAVNTNFDPNQSVPFALTGKVDKKLEASTGH
ncbi:MAG: DUF1573 domain-containing protein [Haliscomenobacteraceae bacterium CHB4]|nr:hypothetical protein [Saprospiraceae bacterium]MCE7922004.1 DUF1573 domain-containing protein [Haliscomenobacteraceae bacterium CHB4]